MGSYRGSGLYDGIYCGWKILDGIVSPKRKYHHSPLNLKYGDYRGWCKFSSVGATAKFQISRSSAFKL